MAEGNWTRMSEAEDAVRRAFEEQNPERASALGLQSCAQMQQDYLDLESALADCWRGSPSPFHACQTLAMQLQALRTRMHAAGCPIPPD